MLGTSAKQLLYTQQNVKSGKKLEMTLGWHVGELNGSIYYFKEGGGAGFCGEMRIYPKSALATVLIANRSSFDFNKNLSKLDENFLANKKP